MGCLDPLKLSMAADGETPEIEAAEHLKGCGECRSSLEQQRRLRGLIGSGRPGSLCPSGEVAVRYLSGDSEPEERAAIEAHAADCTLCRRTLYVIPGEPGLAAPPGLPARVRARLATPTGGVRILRLAASVATALLVAIAIWMGRAPGHRPYEHLEGAVEDVKIKLDLRGALAVGDGGYRFDLLHSAQEAYEQKIVRLDGGRPAEVERRHAGSDLVVRLRRTPAGKTEIVHLSSVGSVELLSVSDNLAVDEACELLAPGGCGIRADALRRLIARMLPKSAFLESLELIAHPTGTGTWRLTGTAALHITASQDRQAQFDTPLTGILHLSGSALALELQARLGPEASLEFALRRNGR